MIWVALAWAALPEVQPSEAVLAAGEARAEEALTALAVRRAEAWSSGRTLTVDLHLKRFDRTLEPSGLAADGFAAMDWACVGKDGKRAYCWEDEGPRLLRVRFRHPSPLGTHGITWDGIELTTVDVQPGRLAPVLPARRDFEALHTRCPRFGEVTAWRVTEAPVAPGESWVVAEIPYRGAPPSVLGEAFGFGEVPAEAAVCMGSSAATPCDPLPRDGRIRVIGSFANDVASVDVSCHGETVATAEVDEALPAEQFAWDTPETFEVRGAWETPIDGEPVLGVEVACSGCALEAWNGETAEALSDAVWRESGDGVERFWLPIEAWPETVAVGEEDLEHGRVAIDPDGPAPNPETLGEVACRTGDYDLASRVLPPGDALAVAYDQLGDPRAAEVAESPAWRGLLRAEAAEAPEAAAILDALLVEGADAWLLAERSRVAARLGFPADADRFAIRAAYTEPPPFEGCVPRSRATGWELAYEQMEAQGEMGLSTLVLVQQLLRDPDAEGPRAELFERLSRKTAVVGGSARRGPLGTVSWPRFGEVDERLEAMLREWASVSERARNTPMLATDPWYTEVAGLIEAIVAAELAEAVARRLTTSKRPGVPADYRWKRVERLVSEWDATR